ncbi:unnamed protein product [Phytophthora lilii]|uniref:Unnamed protein product n=1 Tax=Phytophthora lilii TaxID=2077276 RepID=A0A9W7D847_9STRA|nr:unnamed protein product [Phytophthora lilii]
MQVGSRVVGKTRRTRGRIGIILGVNTEGRQRKFEVKWSCGTRETVAARSISLAAIQEPQQGCESVPNASTSTFTELLLGVSEGGASVDLNSSSSSDEDELNCEESNEQEEDDGAIYANGRKWTPCESVLLDPGAHVQPHRACLLWPQPLALGDKTLAKYFYLMYPMSTLRNTMSSTNYNLQKKQYRRINVGDWFKWIGIRLAMAFEPRRGPLPTYWDHASQDGSVSTAANFGQRFGMTRHCFEQLLSCMSFGKSIVEGDPWMPIRPFLDGFNERRLQVVSPGSVLCVDESMSAWKGREGKYCYDGIPHKTKIVRKPEGLGAELKGIADGDTGIILSLELIKGSTRQRQKPYAAEYGEGTAVVLRLAERFRGTGLYRSCG